MKNIYDNIERKWFIEIVLRGFVEDCLETLEYYPANSDGGFSEKTYCKTIDNILDRIVEDRPEQIFKFISEELKNL